MYAFDSFMNVLTLASSATFPQWKETHLDGVVPKAADYLLIIVL